MKYMCVFLWVCVCVGVGGWLAESLVTGMEWLNVRIDHEGVQVDCKYSSIDT